MESSLPIDLLKKIRKGRVILWVGSGLSLLAGFPSGNGLVEIIKSHVDQEHRDIFDNLYDLTEVTEEYIKKYSREQLLDIIKTVYGKAPNDLKVHKDIKKIPQISNIITTNYDKSFEAVYKDDLIKVVNDNDIPKLSDSHNLDKTKLYKIHGDIDDINTILITQSDYDIYFEKDLKNFTWINVRNLVAQYSVLFIGYSFNDSNIKSIFDDIIEKLRNSHNDYFLIAPDIPLDKQKSFEKYSIKYINMRAEDAIPIILKDINRHIVEDGLHSSMPISKWYKALEDNNLKVKSTTEDGKETKLTIESIDGTPSMVSIKSNKKPNLAKLDKLNNLRQGKEIGACELLPEDEIDVEIRIGDCLIYGFESYEKNSTTITNSSREIKADVVLKNSRKGFSDVKGEHITSGQIAKIKLYVSGLDIVLDLITESDGKIKNTINFKPHIDNIVQGFNVFNFLNECVKGDELQIYFNFLDKPFPIPLSNSDFKKELVDEIEQNFLIFDSLFTIQNNYNIKYDKNKELTFDELENIYLVGNLLKKTTARVTSWKTNLSVDFINSVFDAENPILRLNYKNIGFKIYNETVIIKNCSVMIRQLYFENKDDILKQINEGEKDINVGSVTNFAETSYLLKCYEV